MRRNGLLLSLALLIIAVVTILLAVKRESVARPEHAAAEGGAGPVRGGDTIQVPGVPEAVTKFMRDGRSWRAARAMRAYLERSGDTRPDALLLAARAEAGWGGWDRVSALLEGKEWLGRARGGEGWFWLARAREEDGQLEPAMKAYDGFLSASRDAADRERRMVAQLRQGLILLRLGKQKEGAARLVAVRAHAPEIASRLDVLAAEALATSGDTAGVRKLTAGGLEGSLARRGRMALVTAYDSAGDAAGARAEARAAGLLLDAARLSLELGDTAAARADLRTVLRNPASAGVAGRAAAELDGLGELEAGERLRVARALAASGRGAR
jgi:soluble lytic murein transglycosylase